MLRGLSKYKLVYKHLWATYGRSWQVRLSFGIQFLARICKLIVLPVALSLIVARLSVGDFAGAYQNVFFYVTFSLLLGVLSPLTKYVGMLGENKVYSASTASYFSQLIKADIEYFHSNLGGYLTTATRHYVDSCVQLVRALRERYMTTLLSIIFPLIVIAWMDLWLGLVALVLTIVQAVYLLWASSAIAPMRTYSRELYKRNSGRMADVIANILAVRSTAQESSYTQRIKKGAIEESGVFKMRYTKQAKLIAARECLTVTFFMVLLWLTVTRMSGGHIAIGSAVLVVMYTTTILNGIYALSDDFDEHDDLVDKVIPAFEVLDRKNTIVDPPHAKPLGKVRGDIRFKDVTFSYNDKEQTVLKKFNLHVPPGQKLGIVGLSGAGKSTLAKLLMRFNDVRAGAILLDGIDVRDIKQTDLRRQIAYVPQEPLLFHATIKENVLLADSNASDAQVRRSLKAAHALQFIGTLPDGIESVVGERGVKLSGGQKQRVAIARAVLRHSPIIILDEATSALDSESEQIIKDSFSEILKGKTAIVIAHRLSTLSEMDRIVVIQKGTCIEDGTHDELLAQDGVYAKLWRRQQQHAEV